MSWFISKTNILPEEVADILVSDSVYLEESDEVTDQLTVAKKLALEVTDSAALGAARTVNVTLSGHANPGHKATDGWVNDYVSVTVSVSEYEDE